MFANPQLTIPQALALAVQRQQAGRLGEAETLYRQILAVQPNHAGALHRLGLIACEVGRHDLAIDFLRRAIGVDPEHSSSHYNLGNALSATGRLDEAIRAYGDALRLNPLDPVVHNDLGIALARRGEFGNAVASFHQALQIDASYMEACNNLGLALANLGRLDEAMAAYDRAIEINPAYAEAHNNLGLALGARDRLADAVAEYQKAIAHRPGYAEAYNNLGIAFFRQDRLADSVAAYRQAMELNPAYAEAHNNIGVALARQGLFDEAITALTRAFDLKASYPEAHCNLGNVLRDRGQFDEAMNAYRRALELNPAYAEAHNDLGNVLAATDRLDDAVASFRSALRLRPDCPEFHVNLGNALKDQGRLEEAVAEYSQAGDCKPSQAWILSNLIYTLLFHPDRDDALISRLQDKWNRQFGGAQEQLPLPCRNVRDPDRRLRIGYVSPDFNRHPICHFMNPLLEAHDRGQVEVYCYASVRRPDQWTERARRAADIWRDVADVDDARLAERIREDEIDILVDLTQHMANNRMLLFARKPAPVQVSWLGYPAGTGLPAIDYRLTDRFMEPEDKVGAASCRSSDEKRSEASPTFGSRCEPSLSPNRICATETPIRLPHCWFCFDRIESPEVAALPALGTGHVTFGCLNNFCKVNEAVLRMWAATLRAVKGSRLLLHCPAGATQRKLRDWFEAQGVAAERLELVGRTANREDYFRLYQRIDIGLDPFPYNGGTTTCDALWMGVPVVSLAGRTAVSRLGLSVLTNLGSPEWVAFSEEEYIAIAAREAGDLARLAELRRTLRARLQASPLMDKAGFARDVESAYRLMWQRWCASLESGASPASQ